jgi:hypothetical protein
MCHVVANIERTLLVSPDDRRSTLALRTKSLSKHKYGKPVSSFPGSIVKN